MNHKARKQLRKLKRRPKRTLVPPMWDEVLTNMVLHDLNRENVQDRVQAARQREATEVAPE